MTMLRTLCKSKIRKATVTEANLDYEGSITLDLDVMEAADIAPYERVQVLNHDNGARFTTYAIPGERGRGIVCLNGPAARQGVVGDVVTVITYAVVEAAEVAGWEPRVISVTADNRVADRVKR